MSRDSLKDVGAPEVQQLQLPKDPMNAVDGRGPVSHHEVGIPLSNHVLEQEYIEKAHKSSRRSHDVSVDDFQQAFTANLMTMQPFSAPPNEPGAQVPFSLDPNDIDAQLKSYTSFGMPGRPDFSLMHANQTYSNCFLPEDMDFSMTGPGAPLFSPFPHSIVTDNIMPNSNDFNPFGTYESAHHTEPPTSSTSSATAKTTSSSSSSNTEATEEAQPHQKVSQEDQVIFASRSHWSYFRATPQTPANRCPSTANIYLDKLRHTLSDQVARLAPSNADSDQNSGEVVKPLVPSGPLSDSVRDKLLIFTQALLQDALKAHRSRPSLGRWNSNSSLSFDNEATMTLPRSQVLESYIDNYLVRFERSYPSLTAGDFRLQKIVQSIDHRISTVLLLLIIALGSMSTDDSSAKYLANGLTEVCRISLIDVAERKSGPGWDYSVIRSALLFTLLAAWNGDKWHMDKAIGQRGMYMSASTNQAP